MVPKCSRILERLGVYELEICQTKPFCNKETKIEMSDMRARIARKTCEKLIAREAGY